MILTTSQIKEITLGALDVIQSKNGDISFKRFTDAQIEFYKRTNQNFHLRAKNSAGIRLSFYTDASSVYIEYEMMRGVSVNYFQLDVLCDGAMIAHTDTVTESDRCAFSLSAPLPDGEHLVTVHLPNLALFTLKSLELADATFARPYKPQGPRILFLGDSITHGAFSVYPSLTYTARLTSLLDADALNQGIGGEIFNHGIIDSDLPFDPEIVTIAFGTNDWSGARNNPELRISRADAYFENVKKAFPRAKIVYISPIWRKLIDEEYATFFPARKEFEALAREKGIYVIDGFTLVPHLPEFYTDGLHPNALGFSLYAENLAVTMRKIGIV